MLYRLHLFPDLAILILSLGIQSWFLWCTFDSRLWRAGTGRRALILLGNLCLSSLFLFDYLLEFYRVKRHVPHLAATWVQAAGLVISVGMVGLLFGLLISRNARRFRPERRMYLRAAAGACIAAPYVMTGAGMLGRNRFKLNTVDVPVRNLPPDLQGLRIAQITDIHLSPFLSEREFARAIDMANEARPHLALVTGDLVSMRGDPLDACLRQLARLRGDAGVLGCLGNHEIYCENEEYVTEQGRRIGIDFLRSRSRRLRFGTGEINFAGVDYQKFNRPYLVGAGNLVVPGVVNVLLSHNPDVFPVAESQGYDLTIAGHTHGGQVNVEILHQNMNVARYFTPYVRGLYRSGKASVYVSSGIGTIGVPVRIGAPPEVAVLRLCAI